MAILVVCERFFHFWVRVWPAEGSLLPSSFSGDVLLMISLVSESPVMIVNLLQDLDGLPVSAGVTIFVLGSTAEICDT